MKEAYAAAVIPVALPAHDNNGHCSIAQRVVGAGRLAIAKADFDKGHDLRETVSAGGAQIVVIR